MNMKQDVFISHASNDKEKYIFPLVNALSAKGVTYWLDMAEIGWGDSIIGKITEGLRTSRRLLLCLSKNFLDRQWPRVEMESALAQQIESGETRLLPLILNSKEEVLAKYPLLRSSAYRLFEQGVESIANEIANLSAGNGTGKGGLHLRIESAHSGRLCDVVESPGVSVKWLASKARAGLGGKERADAGALELFPIRWILVDVEADDHWRKMSESNRQEIWALAKVENEFRIATEGTMSLEELGVQDGAVFHLYGIALGDVLLAAPRIDSDGTIIV